MYKIKKIIIKSYLLMSIFFVVYVILTQNFFQYRWDASMLHVTLFSGSKIVSEPFLLFVYGFTLFSIFIFFSFEIYNPKKKKLTMLFIICFLILFLCLFSHPNIISFLIGFPLKIFDFILNNIMNTKIPYFFIIKFLLTIFSVIISSILYMKIRKYLKKWS